MISIHFNPTTIQPDMNRLHLKTNSHPKLIATQLALFFREEQRLFQEIAFVYDNEDKDLKKIYAILYIYYRLRMRILPFLTRHEDDEYSRYMGQRDVAYTKLIIDEMPYHFDNPTKE